LEFAEPAHWQVFEGTPKAPHLNAFIERPVIRLWAEKLGFEVQEFIDAGIAVKGSSALGQSTVILTKN
jgi:hypothetical protein